MPNTATLCLTMFPFEEWADSFHKMAALSVVATFSNTDDSGLSCCAMPAITSLRGLPTAINRLENSTELQFCFQPE